MTRHPGLAPDWLGLRLPNTADMTQDATMLQSRIAWLRWLRER